jgi:transcription elongation factor Elf1
MSKIPKDKRVEVYKDRRAQLLLSKFLGGELTKLEPVFNSKYGYRYPIVEKITGDAQSANGFLKHLFEVGILKRELFDKIIRCLHCDSANIAAHYRCPYCNSFKVSKSSLIEHVSCGYIDTEEKFQKEDKLVCPKCRKELTKLDVDYRKAGAWCTCNECDKSFDIPVFSHFCRDCRQDFTFGEALYEDVFSYSLSEDVVREAALGWILIAPIKEFLESRGFEVESPGFLKGKSGTNHMFDLTASRDGKSQKVTAIDLAASTGDVVSEQVVIAMFAKVYDVVPDRACLVAIPKMSKDGSKLAELYKIKVIEAKNQEEAINALKESIKE